MHDRIGAKCLSQIVQDRAYIGAFADRQPHNAFLRRFLKCQQLNRVHSDIPRRALDRLALAGKIIQLLSVHLDRGIHRRHLLLRAEECRQRPFDRCAISTYAAGAQRLPGHILRIRAETKRKARLIGFILRRGKVGCLGRAADKYRQHAGRQWVERAAVTDFPRVQNPAQLGHHIMRGKALRLVHQQDAVQFSVLHDTAPVRLQGSPRRPPAFHNQSWRPPRGYAHRRQPFCRSPRHPSPWWCARIP